MPIKPEEYQQVTIHEASHVTEAIGQGFRVYGVMFDGPEDQAGCIWRVFPEGKSAETHQDWARKELAVFCAGYMGERVFYKNKNDPRFLVGPDGDTAMIDYLAFQASGIKADEAAVNAALAKGNIPRDQWRKAIPQLQWKAYDLLIKQVEGEVEQSLKAKRTQIEQIAKESLDQGHISGRRLYEILGVPWIGKERKVAWVDFPKA
jgi:hypothetical protein